MCTVATAGHPSRCYLSFALQHVTVDDVSFGPNRGETTLEFNTLTETFRPVDLAGNPLPPIHVTMDRTTSVLVAGTFVGAPSAAASGTNLFLRPGTIQGDSRDATHPNWSSATGGLFTMTRTPAPPGAVPGPTHFENLDVKKGLDRASLNLLGSVVTGQVLSPINLEACPSAGGTCPLRVTLTNGRTTLFDQAPDHENVAFSYQTIEVLFQDSRGTVRFAWNVSTKSAF